MRIRTPRGHADSVGLGGAGDFTSPALLTLLAQDYAWKPAALRCLGRRAGELELSSDPALLFISV